MLQTLKGFFSKTTPVFPPLYVDHPLYIVGDIHGRLDLMVKMLDMINADYVDRDIQEAPKLLFVGDYIDRGDASAQVLNHVYDMVHADPDAVICLKGNHEKMMLDFLSDPVGRGGRWMRYGGLQTLASFGVRGITERSGEDQLEDAADALREVLPKDMLSWLKDLPTQYQTGNLTCVHAGLDPNTPIEGQSDRTRIWGHKDFMYHPRQDGRWIAHGHTIVDTAGIDAGRLAVDTGAYATGRLSAAGLSGSECWILQT